MFGQVGPTEFDLRFYLFGIPVRVHPMFWLISVIMVWNSTFVPFEKVLGILCVFVSILVHELGHALVARSYKFPTEIVLHGMGGYATAPRCSTWREVWLSFAGPLAGFITYGLTWGVIYGLRYAGPEFLRNEALLYVLGIMLFINGYWSLVNLIPCLPLDGGRIMQALVLRYFPRRGHERAFQISILASGAMAVYAFQHIESMRYVLFLFGFICIMNINNLNQIQGRRF